MPIITVTLNPCIDKTFWVERLVPEVKLSAKDVRLYPGGGGINVARAICRLGGDALALWSCGGSVGEVLARLLDLESVPHHPLCILDSVRENLIVTDASSGQQYRFGMPGPELTLDEREAWLLHVRKAASSTKYAVISGSPSHNAPIEWYGELIQEMKRKARVVVDARGEALVKAADIGVYLVKPSLREIEELTGRQLPEDDQIGQAARSLIQRGAAEVILVSLGRGGALLATAELTGRFSAPTVPVRSTVGAGDSMVGGLIVALEQGLALADAARFGVAAAAASVMREGTELCHRDDTDRLFPQVRCQEVRW
jgi:6-phosphofructokinase 2